MRGQGPRQPLLRVEDLSVAFRSPAGAAVPVVRGLSLELGRGEMVGLVGESGCGKTITALALMRLLPPGGSITGGRAWLAPPSPKRGLKPGPTEQVTEQVHHPGRVGEAEDLLALPEEELRRRRGSRLALVFQEPMTALNPVLTIGRQVVEAVRAHRPLSRTEARRVAVDLLERVALPDAPGRLSAYPHELSGGQRQRVVIAMALAGEPDLLLADEPTTALDVTVQAQILELLDRLRRELDLTVLLITHDLAVVAETCERVVVMYAGQVVEEAAADILFRAPSHPYTAALLAALPQLGRPVPRGELPTVPGRVPAPSRLPRGCPFHPRCRRVMEVCRRQPPDLYPARIPGAEGGRAMARCFLHGPAEVEP